MIFRQVIEHLLSLTNSTLFNADTILRCTKKTCPQLMIFVSFLALLSHLHSVNMKSNYSYSTNCGIMKSHFPYHSPCSTPLFLFMFWLFLYKALLLFFFNAWFYIFSIYLICCWNVYNCYVLHSSEYFIQHYSVSFAVSMLLQICKILELIITRFMLLMYAFLFLSNIFCSCTIDPVMYILWIC